MTKLFSIDLINTAVLTVSVAANSLEEAERIAHSWRLTADFNSHNRSHAKVCVANNEREFADNTIRSIRTYRHRIDVSPSTEWSKK